MNASWFVEAIDLSENLDRALEATARAAPCTRRIQGVGLLLICVGLLPLVWHFDVEPTALWTASVMAVLGSGVPVLNQYVLYGQTVAVALTLLPSAVELFGARLSRAKIHVAAVLVYGFCLFDLATDWPRVVSFAEQYRPVFELWGWFGVAAFVVFRVLWLFLSAFGFEVCLIVSGVSSTALLLGDTHVRKALAGSAHARLSVSRLPDAVVTTAGGAYGGPRQRH